MKPKTSFERYLYQAQYTDKKLVVGKSLLVYFIQIISYNIKLKKKV